MARNKLALAMIVKNEEQILGRCLAAAKLLTENILVVDTGSTDKTVEVARQNGAVVKHFEWIEDFAAARNFSFDSAIAEFDPEYLLWLDADDVLEQEQAAKAEQALNSGNYDVLVSKYIYGSDEFGNPTTVVMRERILRTSLNPRWQGVVHECIPFSFGGRILHDAFDVKHLRPMGRNPSARNLRIYDGLLAKVESLEKFSTRDLYYYARELNDGGRQNESISAYTAFVSRADAWWEDKATALCAMARISAAGPSKNLSNAMAFAARAAAVKHSMAEAYCLLGEFCASDNQWSAAIHWYEIAAATPKSRDALGSSNDAYHTWIPHVQLCMAYFKIGNKEKAHYHNECAAKYRPTDKNILHNRKLLAPDTQDTSNVSDVQQKEEPVRETEQAKQSNAPLVLQNYFDGLSLAEAKAKIADLAQLEPGRQVEIYCIDGNLAATMLMHKPTNILKAAMSKPGSSVWSYRLMRKELETAGIIISEIKTDSSGELPILKVKGFKKNSNLPTVGWLAPELLDMATVRIRALNINTWLQSNGIGSSLITMANLRNNKYDYVIVGKYWDDAAMEAVKSYKNRTGGYVIADFSEDYFQINAHRLGDMLGMVDLVVCCSSELAKKVRAAGAPAIVIEDAVESDDNLRSQFKPAAGRRLKCGWCGYGGSAKYAEKFRPMLDRLGYDLVTIHEWENANIPWRLNTWAQELAKCDIAISPQNYTLQPCKSNNKLTTAMALGLPAVVSPLQSYLEIARHGIDSFVVTEDAEWERAFIDLLDDNRRQRVANAAYIASHKFRLNAIGARWIDLFTNPRLHINNGAADTIEKLVPQVDIIIPTYNNPDLLELCVRALAGSTKIPFKVTVVDNGTKRANHASLKQDIVGGHFVDYDVIMPSERKTFSQSNNIAIRATTAKYVCMLNDDTIPTPGWLERLQESVDAGVGIVGPYSNCDIGWLHNNRINVAGVDLHPGMHVAQVSGILPQMAEYGCSLSATSGKDTILPWVAFYCVLMKRDLIDAVGLLDETFLNGGEDADYCYRAGKLGYSCAWKSNSFVFHFGGKSRKVSENEDFDRHHREDRFNNSYLKQKWAEKTVVFYNGPAWEKWSPSSVKNGGIGGSETAIIHMAAEINKIPGYRAIVFNDCANMAGTYDGVEYRSFTDFPAYVDQNFIDVFVSSRDVDVFRLNIRAARKLCWVHDIWLTGTNQLPADQNKVDYFLCLSRWHKHFFCQHHNIDPARVRITRNGIDLTRFSGLDPERDRYRFIYSSSPDRGLDVLLGMWPEILKIEPRANLRVFYGFDNWNKSIDRSGNDSQKAYRDSILAQLKQPNIEVYGRVSQDRLAQEMRSASIWAYPTHFWETFCITALEAQASGLAVIASGLAGLLDTVKSGILVGKNSTPGVIDYDNSWREVRSGDFKTRFLVEVYKVLASDSHLMKLSEAGKAAMFNSTWECDQGSPGKSFSWGDVALAWVNSDFWVK